MRIRLFTFLLLIGASLVSIAQKTDTAFQKEWLEIDTLIIKNDLTKTALNKVNIIYQKAKLRQLSAQVTKSLIYRYTLQDKITSNDPNQIVKSIRTEVELSKDEIQKAILYSLLAKQYRRYYTNHRWNLLSRKNTVQQNKEDIATWSVDDFLKPINHYYLLSLKNKTLLLQQKVETYDAVVINGNRRNLRPTIFDLLAHEALDYFKSGEMYVTKPVKTFIITDPNTLGSMDIFTKSTFPTKDSSSLQWAAIQLFQQLLLAHQNDNDKNALLNIDIERIEWIYQQANFNNKEIIYQQTLENITEQYNSVAVASQAWYLLANLYANKAATYEPLGDTTNRYAYVKAKQITEKALSFYDENTHGVSNLRNLLLTIERKELRVQTETVNIPQKPFRSLVTYRNVGAMFIRIIRMNSNEISRNETWDKEFWQSITKRKSYAAYTQILPVTNDHQTHSVEIKTDALPLGQYVMLISNNASFNDTLDKLGLQFFTISNISYVQNKHDFFVLRRDNGKPIPNTAVTILKGTYNSKNSKWIDEKIDEKISDNNGYFTYTVPRYNYNISLQFTNGNDKLDLRQREGLYYDNDFSRNTNDADYEKNRRLFFYTDRGIYRPGQTVFFKGIAVTTDSKTKLSKLYTTQKPVLIYLRDANGKKYDSLSVTLNEYGSLTGKFQIPQNVLTGRFSVMTENFHQVLAEFNVEEYKRPKFNITFEKAKGAYRLNDSVTIIGTANAFAGNHIDGANVVYSVRRNTRFRYDNWSYRRPYPSTNNREISHGEIKTDTQGRFTITFKASADDIVDKTGNPLFDFYVSADVTDISGETRSNNTTVTVGYSSMLLQIGAPDVIETDSLKNIKISSTNLSYEKEPAIVNLKIYSLVAPEYAVRKRYWQRPDQFVMSKKEFANNFPNDEYQEESEVNTWSTAALVAEETVNTKEKDSFAIASGSLQPGHYRIEITSTDKYGEKVKQVKYIALFSSANKRMPSQAFQFNYTKQGTAKPGEEATFFRSSVAEDLFIIRKTDRPRRKNEDYILLDKLSKFETITYTPDETDRGGVGISEVYVYDNRVYTHEYNVTIPWSNKELAVKYATYRDKTEPGSKETWTITVQNDKNEKVPAELMTAMYDASLDQFKPIDWNVPSIWETHGSETDFTGVTNFNSQQSQENYIPEIFKPELFIAHDYLAADASELLNKNITRWLNDSTVYVSIGNHFQNYNFAEYGAQLGANSGAIKIRGMASRDQNKAKSPVAFLDGNALKEVSLAKFTPPQIVADEEVKEEESKTGTPNIITRKNFSETAFFFPQLNADSTGSFQFSFTMPEALTQWKWMSLAHTKDLAFGIQSANIVTQKKLMVQPNAPRFLREGDHIELSSKIVNLSDKEVTGQVSLELVDASTNTSVDGWFQNIFPSQYFSVEAGQSFAVKFPLQIPFSFNRPLTWRIKARAGEFSDGEENTLPVLTNRQLVTESLPLFLPTDTTQKFSFDKLLHNTSESLTHEALTIEFSTNPVWYAIKALPYLMEYPYDCAEQTFNRFYANALAAWIVNKDPKIKKVFEQWKSDTASLKSNLQKNEELKQTLLQETPWVFQAESEEQQQKNIALLFDLVKLGNETESILQKLFQLQLPNGSFSWFKGGNEDRFMTNYILTGIGKLKRLGALSPETSAAIRPMLLKAIQYLDEKNAEDYNWLVKNKADLSKQHIGSTQIDYLYMRSFFRDLAQQSPAAYQYYFTQGKQFWNTQNTFYKAKLGLIYYRNGEEKFASTIISPALLENTITDSKQGMYWKTTYTGYWYASPIEHQSMMIAFFSELAQNKKDNKLNKDLDAMKTWLLLNKQTNHWKTTIATADACYALLLNGTDCIQTEKKLTIQLGKMVISSNNEKTEAGTGYFKKRIDGKLVTPDMGNIVVSTKSEVRGTNNKTSQSPAWGSIYWQYFEDLDKITPSVSPLSLTKKLFVEKNTDRGVVLNPVNEGDELKTGDKIIVRIELRSNRDMEYLHLKDMRASAMEPLNVLSGYKWQNGLGYYESTKDVSSNFFISHLAKGTYVFDYPLFITHTGQFSVGIATIQSMYAPEFTSHSAGIKIRVAN